MPIRVAWRTARGASCCLARGGAWRFGVIRREVAVGIVPCPQPVEDPASAPGTLPLCHTRQAQIVRESARPTPAFTRANKPARPRAMAAGQTSTLICPGTAEPGTCMKTAFGVQRAVMASMLQRRRAQQCIRIAEARSIFRNPAPPIAKVRLTCDKFDVTYPLQNDKPHLRRPGTTVSVNPFAR